MSVEKPLVSVIMNCHNGEKYLEQSVKSVINQTYNNWELIFWDNDSNDNSKNIIYNFSDDRIKFFKSTNFKKLYESRNLAIQKAKGKFVSFLDTDDMWELDKIEKQVNFLEKNKDFEIVYSNYYILDEIKKKKTIMIKNKLKSGLIFNNLLKDYSVGIITVCLNRDIFQNYSFDKKFDIIGDFDLILRLSETKKIGYIHDALAIYRLHESNLSKKKVALHINEMQGWIKFNKDKLRNKKNFKFLKFYLFKLKFKNFFRFLLN
jgi:glycosyltransferase involved in cell wall biosynthesis